MESLDGHSGGLADRLANTPGGAEAVDAVEKYAPRLHIHRASGGVHRPRLDPGDRSTQVIAETGAAPVVVVDYLQKVPVLDRPLSEEDRITTVAQGLKDLALERDVAVFAVVASDKEGITSGRRMRVHHLRGAAALAYEADVVLVINDKYDVVARHHLVFDVGNAERFRDYVVVTIEKNRTGHRPHRPGVPQALRARTVRDRGRAGVRAAGGRAGVRRVAASAPGMPSRSMCLVSSLASAPRSMARWSSGPASSARPASAAK